MATNTALALPEEDMGIVDLLDPEVEYTPPPEPPAPRLEVIVNDNPRVRGGYGKLREVDLRIYDGDPTAELLEESSSWADATISEDTLDQEGVLVDGADGALPEAHGPRDLEEHQEAVAGHPQDALQAYFLEGIPREELDAAAVAAAAILKTRHELFLLESQRWVPESLGTFRESSLGTLLGAMPPAELTNLYGAWRAAMRSLSEYFESAD